MAATEFVSSMDDYRMKPAMLRSVVRDRLLNEKRPFPSFTELSAMVSHMRTHGLLSECHPDTSERQLVEEWKVTVDGWVEHIISLASSKVPNKCWAGIYLLGVTCNECCSDRFRSSYAIWIQKLMENIQSPSRTDMTKIACASLDDLFKRLTDSPILKKDGTSFAGKIIQPLLQMLNEDAGETFWEDATTLLCTLISFFPSSIQRHYDNVEAVLTSKIMAAKCNLNTSKKLAHILALLPKVKGDKDSWCLVIQKILIAINSILTDAFQGFEEEKKSFEIMKMIVPPGKDPPPPLGGQTLSGEAFESVTKRLSELLVPRVTTLMHSCCNMLTNPDPDWAPIFVRPLLDTVERVLQVDGSFCGSLFPLITSMHQELLCAELPALHLCSLDLLIAIIESSRSQVFPHSAYVMRLLIEYFQRAKKPFIRKRVYSVVHMLLISMGVGMTVYLAQVTINNAYADLIDEIGIESIGTGSSTMQSSIVVGGTFQQNYHRKRKRASVISVEYPNGVDLSIKSCNKKPQAPFSVKIAAVEALKALLTVDDGSLGSECWRPDVDFLVVTVATNACDAGWASEDKMFVMEDEPSFADFQLATLKVLLASLLSPTQTPPPYLCQGLDLFHRGWKEAGLTIATFCADAHRALGVRIHPRALPLVDHPPIDPLLDEGFNNKRYADNIFNSGIKANLPSFSKDDLALLDEEDDENLLNSSFDKNNEQTFVEGRNLNDKHSQTTKQSSNASEHIIAEKPSTINVDVEMVRLGRRDETAVYRDKAEESEESSFIPAMEMALGKKSHILHFSDDTSKEDRLSDLNKGKDVMLSYDDSDTGSQDSLPDIVDADPDTEIEYLKFCN